MDTCTRGIDGCICLREWKENAANILRTIAYPKHGTDEESTTILDAAQIIQATFSADDLSTETRIITIVDGLQTKVEFTTEPPIEIGWYFVNNGKDPADEHWSIKMIFGYNDSHGLGMRVPNCGKEEWYPLSDSRFDGWRYMGPITPAAFRA
ncbi:MAG TPA: hypothetical protein VN039_02865 [Nitrospira sp.]|nr:hypothetical protein [Nitrospira sp.]